MSRHDYLMTCLQLRFRQGQSFDGDFLREHNVSAPECADLESGLATAIGLYLDTHRELGQKGLTGTVAAKRLANSLLTRGLGRRKYGRRWTRLKSQRDFLAHS